MSATVSDHMRRAVEGLAPGYFAFVMATGIISVGMKLEGFQIISAALLIVCGIAFIALLWLTLWRFVAYRSAINKDFFDPARAFGFFTFVAGTNVLGVRVGMDGHYTVTAILLAFSGVAAAWLRGPVDCCARPRGAAGGRDREWHVVHLGGCEPVGRHRCRDDRARIRDRPPRVGSAGRDVLVGRRLFVCCHRGHRVTAADALRVRT